eukprot:3442908-Rhodomonas_salina.5
MSASFLCPSSIVSVPFRTKASYSSLTFEERARAGCLFTTASGNLGGNCSFVDVKASRRGVKVEYCRPSN